jgi:hypothetical protein
MPGHGHCMLLLFNAVSACACARAWMLRPRSGTRGRALSRRLRRAPPRPRALRPTEPRAKATLCWHGGRRSRVRSGRPGQRPPRRLRRWTPCGGARVSARRARAQRQRRGGRPWHRCAGMRPAWRARAGDRPCIHLIQRSRAHKDPCAAAALCPCKRDMAEGVGSGQTCRSTHRRQGRVVGGRGSASLGSSLMRVRPGGWPRPLRRARLSKLCVGKAGTDAAALQLAALSASGLPLRCWRGAPATL